jgi:D-alanyl-D-alanine carboxypeptidase/D-alanyl-D-alanine-endopeptidase (penicillin-binding protein 4)
MALNRYQPCRQVLASLCVVLAALAVAAFFCVATASASTEADVRRAVGTLRGASGAYVFNITEQRRIASRRSARARILASNTKLFTGAAALSRFGTGGRFSTGVYTDAPVADGVVSGSLYIRGGGDPLFGSADYVTRYFGSRATLEQLAKILEAAGIKAVRGGIYGDQRVFDARRGTAYSGWSRSSDIGGVLGGLIVNKGFTSSGYQSNPPAYAAQRLRAALKKNGVKVTSRTGAKAAPRAARRLASVRSLPASALVRQMNKPSNNYLAEMLVKSLALPAASADDDTDGGEVPFGSTRATTKLGADAAEAFASRLGSSVQLSDGSGLSRADRAAPREVVDLLRGMIGRTAFDDFWASLPIAGVDGTLQNRMRGKAAQKRCRAKTGTLSNVSSLSGYCRSVGGDLIAFSIVQNSVSTPAAKAREDRIASVIAALR